MSELERLIKDRVRKEGRITFRAFMEAALYHPGLGYYTSPDTGIGRSGDFYTSPHLHPVFGAMLGIQAEEMWDLMGRPPEFAIVEAGGGRGWLAKDMLDFLKGKPIYEGISYTLVELNPDMRDRQGELLKEHSETVRWTDKLGDIKPVVGMVLTNELFDAMPVHLVDVGKGKELKEIYVTLDDERLVESPAHPSTPEISEYFPEFGIALPERYRTEVNLVMRDWIVETAAILKEGFIVTIDYGYPARELYSPERDRGTLMCYHRHQVNEDPFINIGQQDLTTHVNFSALKKWGKPHGLKSLGFTRQGPYLVSLGIDGMLSNLIESSPDYRRDISRVKGLIMPDGMGDSHKVLIQYKGEGQPVLKGFRMKNEVDVL